MIYLELHVHIDGIFAYLPKTTTKIRVLSGHQQMMRIDFKGMQPLKTSQEQNIMDFVNQTIDERIDAVVISDYGKGVCTDKICDFVIHKANKTGIPTLVDPKGANWKKYSNATSVTPNVKELGEVSHTKLLNEEEVILPIARDILRKYNLQNILVTRSEAGMTLVTSDSFISLPTQAKEVFDVSGAGDTVISAFTAAISAKISPTVAACMANIAAGIEVSKVGTYAVSAQEIDHEITNTCTKNVN
jgi:rfaE bifunctional protein kinase chain/domain